MTIILKKVCKIYNKETNVLEDINLTIQKGEFVCLLGKSGCGKTTLLNIIAGLEKTVSGEVFINDNKINSVGLDRAMIFQESVLFPWLKVIENVEYGMKIANIPKVRRRELAKKYLSMVKLDKFENSFIHELSGGMKQRVALARALSLDSEVLLMDEPFSDLDTQTREVLREELVNIWNQTRKTIIFVTHDINEAIFLGDRVLVMSSCPGRIKMDFKIQVDRPKNMDNEELLNISREIMQFFKEDV